MRVAVAGGTGVVGRHVVDAATARGHEPVVVSRSSGVDLQTGSHLEQVLEGCDVVIDVSNVATIRRRKALAYFEAATRHLQRAARNQDVGHMVVLSIAGVDRLRSLGYYDAKVTQERLHLAGPVDATVIRSTQFHEFALQAADRARVGPVALVPSLLVRTVAARSVAQRLVELAEEEPVRGRAPDVAGPGPAVRLEERTREALARSGSRTRVVPLPLAGAAGRAIAAGALLGSADAMILGPSFEEWIGGPDFPR